MGKDTAIATFRMLFSPLKRSQLATTAIKYKSITNKDFI